MQAMVMGQSTLVQPDGDPYSGSVVLLVQNGSGSVLSDQSGVASDAAINDDAAWSGGVLNITRNYGDIAPFIASGGASGPYARASGEEYTIEVWFEYATGTLQNVTVSAQLVQLYGAASGFSIGLYGTTGQIEFFNSTNPQTVLSDTASADSIHHLQATMTASNVLYVDLDGTQISTETAYTWNGVSDSYVFVGNASGAVGGYSSDYKIHAVRITKGVARPRGSVPALPLTLS